jgi:hypothetical protein
MQDTTTQSNAGAIGKSLLFVAGVVAVVIGLIGSSFGSAWSPQVYEFLFRFEFINFIDSFMPYFPLVPFYPIFIMILGAVLMVKSRN